MRRGVARIGLQSLSGRLEGQVNLAFALARLQQECVLKMRERQPRIAAREGRIEGDRSGEELPRLTISAAGKPVHQGEPAVVRLPRVERGGRREQRPIAFDEVNFRIKTCDDPRGQQGWRGEGLDGVTVELVRPKDATAAGIAELDRNEIFLA